MGAGDLGSSPNASAPPLQDGDLDAVVVLYGALEEVVQVLVAVPGHAPGDARVVPQALRRASQSLPAARIVRQASLGLEGALVHQTVLIDQGRVEGPPVLRRQLVLGRRRSRGEEDGGAEGRGRDRGGQEPSRPLSRGNDLPSPRSVRGVGRPAGGASHLKGEGRIAPTGAGAAAPSAAAVGAPGRRYPSPQMCRQLQARGEGLRAGGRQRQSEGDGRRPPPLLTSAAASVIG